MAFKLLNIALDFEESNFNNNIKSLIRKKNCISLELC